MFSSTSKRNQNLVWKRKCFTAQWIFLKKKKKEKKKEKPHARYILRTVFCIFAAYIFQMSSLEICDVKHIL